MKPLEYKYYVVCGDLQVIVIAKSWWDACRKANQHPSCHNGITLDPHFFYVDQRGFRGPGNIPMAAFKVPVHEICGECEA